jgi:CCR4-NOT transcription complex subunit 1
MEAIPLTCVQLRNLVLAASPKGLRLSDPFRELQPEALPESSLVPRVLGNVADVLPPHARAELDHYLRTRAGPGGQAGATQSVVAALRLALVSDPETAAVTLNRVNLRVMQALVVALVSRAVGGEPGGRADTAAVCAAAAVGGSASTDVLRALVVELDAEARFALLNSVVCQLRFPSAHTLFASRFVLGLFADPPAAPGAAPGSAAATAQRAVVREQIARALMERISELGLDLCARLRAQTPVRAPASLAHERAHMRQHRAHTNFAAPSPRPSVVHRPHPWGVLSALSELVRSPGLFQCAFVTQNADIARLFESVARSCGSGGGAGAAAAAGAGAASAAHSRSNSIASTASDSTTDPS